MFEHRFQNDRIFRAKLRAPEAFITPPPTGSDGIVKIFFEPARLDADPARRGFRRFSCRGGMSVAALRGKEQIGSLFTERRRQT